MAAIAARPGAGRRARARRSLPATASRPTRRASWSCGVAYKPGVADVPRVAGARRSSTSSTRYGRRRRLPRPARPVRLAVSGLRSIARPRPGDYDLVVVAVRSTPATTSAWLDASEHVLDATYTTLGRLAARAVVRCRPRSARRHGPPRRSPDCALRCVASSTWSCCRDRRLQGRVRRLLAVRPLVRALRHASSARTSSARFAAQPLLPPAPPTPASSRAWRSSCRRFNEEAAIAGSLRSLLALDYPADKLEVVAVNDGSTDGTLARDASEVAAEAGGRVQVIDLGSNRGKRAAMAAGIRATEAEIVAFVDSDSVLEPDALRMLVQGFADSAVGRDLRPRRRAQPATSRADAHAGRPLLRRLQGLKAAESVFNAVTCCSGCFSAYRREAIMPHLERGSTRRSSARRRRSATTAR